MPLQGAEGKSGNVRAAVAVIAVALVAALLSAAPSEAAEPNNDFATATGPLNAGQDLQGEPRDGRPTSTSSSSTCPDTAEVTVTTINKTPKRGGAADKGRTIVSSLLRARKGKLPQPVAGERSGP